MNYFITAIGTDSGKTVISAVLVKMLGADYWKPIQAGSPRDTDQVMLLIQGTIHDFPERYYLTTPASPHAAARIDGVEISLEDFLLPSTDKPLVIEGAGGVLVPINDRDYVIDLAPRFQSEIVLVADLYLGSINHTLLTCELLKNRKYPVKGIIFNGRTNPESEQIILKKSGLRCLLRVDWHEEGITPQLINQYANRLKENW